jgi:molybdopterin-guanine dinucleotide biosynthesis protein A
MDRLKLVMRGTKIVDLLIARLGTQMDHVYRIRIAKAAQTASAHTPVLQVRQTSFVSKMFGLAVPATQQ